MVEQYVTKAHRQHTSVVTSIPKPVQQAMQLTSGDYLVFQVDKSSVFVQLSKLVARGDKHDRGTKHSDRESNAGGL